MKTIIAIFISVLCFSCKSTYQTIKGEYYKNGKDFKQTLIIGTDSTFTLTQTYFEVISKCKGQWIYLAKDTILLKCFNEEFPAQISSGYMNEREKKVIILKGNKLKIGNIILKHKN